MLTRSRCIVLRVIKFKDSQMIVSVLSRELGRISIIVTLGKGRESARKRALLMPGSGIDAIIDMRENRSLQTLADPMPTRTMLLDNPVKTTLILFVCDFLNTILRDCQPDETLFEFADSTIDEITRTSGSLANLPICFLIELQRFMGIEPDVATYRPGAFFDMTNGVFRNGATVGSRLLDPRQSAEAVLLCRMNRRNQSRFRLSRADRAEALDLILEYYSIHFGTVRSLNSLDVLRSLFD